MNEKISQSQLRSVARELIPFWHFEPARLTPIKLAYVRMASSVNSQRL